MEVEGRLVDGRYGYTDAQYANSAYRAKGWYNRAEMVAGGTIRVMRGKVINEGDEILFAYHGDYWRRWGPERKKSGRKRRAAVQPAVGDDDERGPIDGANGDEGGGLGGLATAKTGVAPMMGPMLVVRGRQPVSRVDQLER